MALNFPASPSIGQDYTVGTTTWVWDGTSWVGSENTINIAGNITGNYIIGNGSSLSSLTGANVIGTVANANYSLYANVADVANGVSVANVAGIGNIATINIDGNASTVLYGNGIFDALPNTATSNYANFAGTVTEANQPNITALGTLTSLTVAGAVNLGDVANLHITGGNSGQILSTDGAGNLAFTDPTSSFSAWDINGNTGLTANGSETVNLVAGDGVILEANNVTKTLTISASGAGGGNIGGSNTQIQFNDAGNFAGATDFTYNKTTGLVSISNTSSGATGIVLGNPLQGNLVSNAVTLTNSTSVTNSIALLNQVLGKLVPPSPPAFPASQSLSIASLSTYRMANFTQTDNTPGANKSVAGGTTVTSVRRAGSYNANVITNAGPGDTGTIVAYLNGANAGGRTLTANLDGNGTYSNLVVFNNYDYNTANSSIAAGFWSVFSARAAGTVSAGWNEVYLSHSTTGNTNTPSWYYDSSAPGTPTFSNVAITEPVSPSYTYSSTVPHYNNTNQFTLTFDVNRLSGDMYPTTDTFATGTAGGAFSAPASKTYAGANITTPLARNLYVSSGNVSVSTTANIASGFGSSSGSPSISVVNSYNTGTQAFNPAATVLYKTGTASAMEEANITIGSTIGSGSGLAFRIINPGSTDTPAYTANATAFNSQSSTLETSDATIVAATLKHDQTDYSTGYLPAGPDLSSGRSGAQYFTFKFIRSSVSKFDIKWTGTIAGLWVALPGSAIDSTSGLNGWLNMATAYAGAGVPGSNIGAGGNGSDGAALGGVAPLNSAQTNKAVTATFGTVSSSSTATNEIYVRIKLTAGQTVTALSLQTASN